MERGTIGNRNRGVHVGYVRSVYDDSFSVTASRFGDVEWC